MSFRARLTIFFVLIVVVPMVAIGVLMFRLINDSEQGKADARASGVAITARSVYESQAATLARTPRRSRGTSDRCAARRSRCGSHRSRRGPV
jgi:sensor histidine kinase regulating citrate/malate metabolism